MHIHLDAVGGVAGDMFIAALLDIYPDLMEGVVSNIRLAGLGDEIEIGVQNFDDGVLTGSRFKVARGAEEAGHGHEAHGHHGDDGHHHPDHDHHHHDHHHPDHGHHHHGHARSHGHHHHTHWGNLRSSLQASRLPDGVKAHVLGIFEKLAVAEARVHGKSVESVAFHEVGNWDSIADIVGAATLIDALAPQSWSVGSLPVGRGLVRTEHGALPVPAPATTLLLKGFAFHDDGRSGERVTPTGAAILSHLSPANGIGAGPRMLRASGHGFGTRKLAGMSNVLRVLVFDAADAAVSDADAVGVIQFEIDDQSGEELAASVDHIRAQEGVIDVIQTMAIGKKGRMMTGIQVLTKPAHLDAVSTACFRQTTTLGLRIRLEARRILRRQEIELAGGKVKVAERPGGTTAKAEMDSVAANPAGHRLRAAARRAAEDEALKACK